MASRRLTDLFVIGREETFDDGQGEPVSVFVRKLNTGEQDQALKLANAVRSKMRAVQNNPDGDEYKSERSMIERFDREQLEDYLARDHREARLVVVQAQVADEDEWKTDGYLDGLRDIAGTDMTDEEKQRVDSELKRYTDMVEELLVAEVDDFRSALQEQSLEELQDNVFEKVFEVNMSLAWIGEYRVSQVFLSVREPDKKTRYFQDRDEIDYLPEEVLTRLLETYSAISMDPLEGKDSRQADSSSESSDSAANKETDASSGLTDAAA